MSTNHERGLTLLIVLIGASTLASGLSNRSARRALETRLAEARGRLSELESDTGQARLESSSARRQFVEQLATESRARRSSLSAILTEKRKHETMGSRLLDRLEALERTQLEQRRQSDARIAGLEARQGRLAREVESQTPRAAGDPTLARLMDATVRLNAVHEVGSGVVIYNDRRQPSSDPQTYILTAYHVIKDNRASDDRDQLPIEVDFYSDHRPRETATANIVAIHKKFDLALLEVRRPIIAVEVGLASTERCRALGVFSPVVTVGCPLGYPPMPTRGELTSKRKMFDGQAFWMTNAPTIFGNSGGGVFDAQSGQLIGLLVRIAAYKKVIDVAVPHLGVVTPRDHIHSWLRSTPYSFIAAQARENQSTTLEAGDPKAKPSEGSPQQR